MSTDASKTAQLRRHPHLPSPARTCPSLSSCLVRPEPPCPAPASAQVVDMSAPPQEALCEAEGLLEALWTQSPKTSARAEEEVPEVVYRLVSQSQRSVRLSLSGLERQLPLLTKSSWPYAAPRKLNFELLAEQERQMAQNSFAMPPSWQRRGGQLPNLASSVPPSLDPEECEGSALDKAGGNSLRRSRSGRSGTGGAESPTDRPMRGLRFVLSPTGEEFASNGPHSPSASLRRDPLSKSHSSVSDGCAVETESDDDHPYFHSLSHSSSVGKSISRRGGHSK